MASPTFSDLVTCVVINLDTRPGRWKRTRLLCRLQGISPIRFEAHDQHRGVRRFPESELSPGALGLWSSFVELLDSGCPTEWLMILEDDVVPLPRFRRRVLHEIRRAEDDVVSIRVGWLGRLSWRPEKSFRTNTRKILRRFRAIVLSSVFRRPPHPITRWGTHALLLRSRCLSQIKDSLGPAELTLDRAFLRVESDRPHSFRVTRKNHAWQWPDRSDISITD